ncbi:hypothetical protein GCM10018793_62870 [Streptomyces sulfonofaciens]|uniref:Uncharacterized protein n=1 Tax=Streptomyces sulfonofaciens TaxID=68272 RepID=A0A919L828_9ACTN|nr:hypothetical protein GCM10018793_62870 [Streptomyces sulfonofaciens]
MRAMGRAAALPAGCDAVALVLPVTGAYPVGMAGDVLVRGVPITRWLSHRPSAEGGPPGSRPKEAGRRIACDGTGRGGPRAERGGSAVRPASGSGQPK